MNKPVIEFRRVSFAYGKRPILSNVSFVIEEGDFAAIMGGSGSGKTTILRLISGQIRPQQGEIWVRGQNLLQFSKRDMAQYRQKMGFLFQFGALFTDLSVFDNIAFPLREHTRLPESIIHDLVLLKLNAVGLRGVEKMMPAELSGGMARRVALARTIALDPEFLLYDEPFTGLDPISLGVIAQLTAQINGALNSTSVMVTHDIGESLKMVNRVIFLAHGEVIFSGSPQEMKQLDSPWIHQFMNGLPDGPVEFRYPNPHSLIDDLSQKVKA